MFRDFPVRAAHYDPKDDSFVVDCAETLPRSGSHAANLLLDVRGHLVGIDFGGEGMDRLVVMLGPHEAVARTTSAKVSADGQTVRVRKARAALPVDELNPYAKP
jgi:hypothetical protein